MFKRFLYIALALVITFAFYAQAFTLKDSTEMEKISLYNDVTYRKVYGGSVFNNVQFDLVEFDLANRNLYLDTVFGGPFITHASKRTSAITQGHTQGGKTPLAGVNGDMWLTVGTHVRILGQNHSFRGYSDSVVKAAVLIPRGYSVVDGEIVSTSHMQQETPYEGDFWAFGITDDYAPIISNPTADVTITNTTQNKSTNTDGINRLPANNALVMYTNKGVANNHCLDDAFEIVVDITSTSRYKIMHGTNISGKVIGVYPANSTNRPTMATNSNYLIFTARGNRVKDISAYTVNDQINIKVEVRDKTNKYTKEWQRAITAIGGHYPFVQNGQVQGAVKNDVNTSFIGITKDGKVVMGSLGGKPGDSIPRRGMAWAGFSQLAKDLNLKEALAFDGGGSTTTVIKEGTNYKVKSNSSDGSERAVLNVLVLSSGPQRSSQGEIPGVALQNMTKVDFTNENSLIYIGDLYDAEVRTVGTKGLYCKSLTGTDPQFYLDYSYSESISTNKYKYLEIEYMIPTTTSANAKQMQIFVMTTTNGPISEANSIRIDMTRDGQYHKALVELKGNMWKGDLLGLRIDFFDKSAVNDSMYIKNLNFYASNPNPTPTPTPNITPTPTPKATSTPEPTPTASAKETAAVTEDVTSEPTVKESPEDTLAPTKEPEVNKKRSKLPLYILVGLAMVAVATLVIGLLINKKGK